MTINKNKVVIFAHNCTNAEELNSIVLEDAVIVTGLTINSAHLSELVEKASKVGGKVILNLSPISELNKNSIPEIDFTKFELLVASIEEAKVLAEAINIPDKCMSDGNLLAHYIGKELHTSILIRNFDNEFALYSNDKLWYLKAPKENKLADFTHYNGSYVSVLAGLYGNLDLPELIKYASIVNSLGGHSKPYTSWQPNYEQLETLITHDIQEYNNELLDITQYIKDDCVIDYASLANDILFMYDQNAKYV